MRVDTAVQEAPSRNRTKPSSGQQPYRMLRLKRHLGIYMFVLVPVLIMVTVEVIPTIGVIWTSFTDYNPLVPGSFTDVVGIDNYERLVHDRLAWQALFNTLYFAALYMPITIFGGLLAAILLNQRMRGRIIFRGIFFLPVIVSWVVAATMIGWTLDSDSGLLAMIFDELGLGRIPRFLQQKNTAMPAVALVAIWKYFGYNTVIFLAGLQSLDPSLDESALVDGASAWQRFWYVTLPMLRPVTLVVIVLNLIQAMRIFDPIIIMTNGGPDFATTSLVVYFYRLAWNNLEFGYGSAITMLLIVLIVGISALQFWYFNRRSADQ